MNFKNKLKKITKVSSAVAISALLFAGCTSPSTQEIKNEVPKIVTTFYPTSDIAKAIAGDTLQVETLIPKGTEPHSFEPTAKQIVELSKADAFIALESIFDSVEKKLIESNDELKVIYANHGLDVIKFGENVELDEHGHPVGEHEDEHNEKENHEDEHSEEEHNDEHEDEHHDHDHGEYDPHVWLSIHNMEQMTEEITEELKELYPQNAELYEMNKVKYLTKLTQLENKFNTELNSCAKDVILVNHKAFGYLANEYNFKQVSASGLSPEAGPTPKKIQQVVDTAKEHNVKVIFSEAQVDPKVAQTLADEIGGQVLQLNPVLTTEKDYFELMEKNLENLKIGLECTPKNQTQE